MSGTVITTLADAGVVPASAPGAVIEKHSARFSQRNAARLAVQELYTDL
jgi:hypothetical protein